MSIRTYSELIEIPSFKERYEYLRLDGKVGEDTFGWSRYLNQALYTSDEWKRTRRKVILRDNGCDLAVDGFEIQNRLLIHHINPITVEDIENCSPVIFDLDNLICCSHNTHEAIHYGNSNLLPSDPVMRRPNDTCLWKK